MSDSSNEPAAAVVIPEVTLKGVALKTMFPTDSSLERWRKIVSIAVSVSRKLPKAMQEIAAIVENVNQLPEIVQQGSLELAKLGWYPDPQYSFDQYRFTLNLAQKKDIDKIDQFCMNHYTQAANLIQMELLAAYPHRAEALRQAFAAAAQEHYFAAIPVLLTQAEGITVEVAGDKLFQSANARPKVAAALETMNLQDFSLQFLEALMHNAGFNASADYRHEFPQSPNRHEILHGSDLNYGTMKSYLKTLSLVSFVGLQVPYVIKSDKDS